MPKFKDLFNEDTDINDLFTDKQIKNMGNTLGNLISPFNEFTTVLGKAILKDGNKLKNFANRLVAFMSQYEALMEKYPELEDTENLFKEHPEYKELEIAELFKVLDKKDLTTLKSIIPNNYIIPNNKLANEIVKDFIGMGEIALTVCKGKKEVLTMVSVDYDSEGIQIYNKSERLTPYDRIVLNSVCSLYDASNSVFTPLMVYRCMNGLSANEKVSPQAVGAVAKSLDKVSCIRCRIDWTAEAKARGSNIDKGIIEGNILATKKITITTGGKTNEAYKLLDKPILYSYAQATKQVITIPIKLLQTKGAIRSTDDVIVIREYLIRRIAVMKGKTKQSNKILYTTIYKELGLNLENKNQFYADKSKKIRNAVKELLNYWKLEKYIIGFTEYKEGKTFKGIKVFY